MATIGELVVKIGADGSNLRKGLSDAGKSVDAFGRKMQSLKTVGQMTIKAKDATVGVLSGIKRQLFNLRNLAVITLSVVGARELGKVTVGAAMDFQKQQISMEHWLKGNKKAVEEVMTWLDKFAAATPFEMTDLFPAMTRGIGISDGNIANAQRLLKISTDMAALTPGKTVQDAMEALADAKMGEFERLKEFNMKYSAKQMETQGGFEGLMKAAEKTFSGGADRLGQSASGLLSTITDTMNTLFRKTGDGVLTSLMPRLQKITNWFNDNPKVVERWRNQLQYYANQAAEKLMVSFENAFAYVKTNWFDNPEFQQRDFLAKVSFIIDDLAQLYDNWLSSGGASKIESFGGKIGRLIADGLKLAAPEIGAALVAVMSATASALGDYLIRATFKDNVVDAINKKRGRGDANSSGVYTLPSEYAPTTPTGGFGNFRQLDRYASGTSYARGGLAWVGERGPELVNFRGGEQVLNTQQSLAAVQGDYTVTHRFTTMDGKLVASMVQQFAQNDRRYPGRVSSLPSMG